jgi:hypothetical protein
MKSLTFTTVSTDLAFFILSYCYAISTEFVQGVGLYWLFSSTSRGFDYGYEAVRIRVNLCLWSWTVLTDFDYSIRVRYRSQELITIINHRILCMNFSMISSLRRPVCTAAAQCHGVIMAVCIFGGEYFWIFLNIRFLKTKFAFAK